MSWSKTFALFSLLSIANANAQQIPAEILVTQIFDKNLTEYPGKEVVMITVEYPPGGEDPVHRHNAHGFIYVLEGTIQMAVRGGQTVTLTAGQTFYESPDDVHTVGRNASNTESAKFLVLLVKNKEEAIFTPLF